MFEINSKIRRTAGKVLFAFISHNREELSKAQNLGTLYVSKDKESKGRKSFIKDEFQTFRTIKFMKDKEFRKKVGRFSFSWVQIFSKHLKAQYGFIPKKGIQNVINENQKQFSDNKIIYSIDMSNAFGQISKKQLYFYIRKGFYINPRDAKLLADSMCYKGFLYQGHPLSPIFFNLHLNKSIIRLSGICDHIVAYADDINLFFKKGISRRVRVLVHFILKENNLLCNKAKCRIIRISSGISILGFSYVNKNFQAKKLSSLKRKLIFLKKLKHSIPKKSTNVNIFIQKFDGLQNFIKDIAQAPYKNFKDSTRNCKTLYKKQLIFDF